MSARDFMSLVAPYSVDIGGKSYRLPPMSIRVGSLIALGQSDDPKVAAQAVEQLNGEWFRNMLGATYDVMVADEVPYAAVERAAATALVLHQRGPEAADAMWETGGLNPEALAALMAAAQKILAS